MASRSNDTTAGELAGLGPGRPWLYPWNRRLRHLNRIVIRNIATVGEDKINVSARSVDDRDLPESFRSPDKLRALDESDELTRRSRSSVDLHRRISDDAQFVRTRSPDQPVEAGKVDAVKSRRARTRLPNLRRMSTLEWAHATSQQRHSRLQQLAETRLVDVFFSLHVEGVGEPVYVSETVENTTSPDFRRVDLEACCPYVLRADTVTLRVWTKRSSSPEFALSLQSEFRFGELYHLGEELSRHRRGMPGKCVVVELTDGMYVSSVDIAFGSRQRAPPVDFLSPSEDQKQALPVSSSFDALLRLSKVDDSVQDALAIRSELKVQLDSTVESTYTSLAEVDRLQQTKDFLKTIAYAKTRLEKQLQALIRSRDQAKEALARKRRLLGAGARRYADAGLELPGRLGPQESPGAGPLKSILQAAILQQRRRICETLQRIYPIAPIPNRPLCFTIRGLHLANSEDLEGASPEQVAGALGYVAHAVQLLAFYLGQPLPYPVFPRSGSSTIHDGISRMGVDVIKSTVGHGGPGVSRMPASKQGARLDAASRIFPLYPRGVPKFRFEYGVFLLNKNIELLLANVYRVRVLDIRQTLPNLLYVLYCATAGEGELPARKAGGIRGLLRTGRGSFGRDDDSVWSADGEDDVPIRSFRLGSRAGTRGPRLLGADGKAVGTL